MREKIRCLHCGEVRKRSGDGDEFKLFDSKEVLLEAWPPGSRTRLRDEVLRLLNNARSYIQGKNPRTAVGGAIWLITSITMSKPPTLHKISDMLKVGEPALRTLSVELVKFFDEEMRGMLPPIINGVPARWLSDGYRQHMMDAFNHDRDTAHLPSTVFGVALEILRVAYSVGQRALTISTSHRALWGAAVRLAAYQMGFSMERPIVARVARVYPSDLFNAETALRTTLTSSEKHRAYRWPEQWGREETVPSC